MSAKVAFSPPPAPEPQKQFATILIGIVLIVVGALLINQGMNTVQASSALILGVGLLAAGALMAFAGTSRVWPGKPMINISMFIVGAILLIASGTQLAVNWGLAVYGIVLTIVGIVLIVVGVQITRQSFKKYVKR
jgi:peptidoglycan/LPS O-acetylase OafA/YrhL